MSYRAQFAVRKQGTLAAGNWSTRTLTIDTDTATVTVSRRNHPNNLLYHTLEVRVVQMWPRFLPDTLDDDYQSLKAKLTLRVVGKEVPVPYFTADDAAVVNTPSLSAGALAGGAGRRGPSVNGVLPAPGALAAIAEDYTFIAGDASKKSRPMQRDATDELYESWMLRFTTIESYEAAVTLLACLRNPDGTVKKVYGDHVAMDLAAVKQAWAARHVTKAAVAMQLSGRLSREELKAATQ